MTDKPQARNVEQNNSAAHLARLLGHYARSFETDIYPMPDSDLPFVLRRAQRKLEEVSEQRRLDWRER